MTVVHVRHEVFLVRALLRGRRWAYRRVIWLGGAGIVGLGILWATPYPAWMRVEQVLQSCVLLGLLYFVLRPEVRMAQRAGFLSCGEEHRATVGVEPLEHPCSLSTVV